MEADDFVGVGDVVDERIGRKTATDISIFVLSPLCLLRFGWVYDAKTIGNLLRRKRLCETDRSREIDVWAVE